MKHGQTRTRLYSIWKNMKQRCYNPRNPKYCSYGGKGIVVCNEWKNSFMEFSKWARKNGYKDPPEECDWWFKSYHTLTIDRIDEHKGYEPSNCRWIPFQENRLHRKSRSSTQITQTLGTTVEDLFGAATPKEDRGNDTSKE